MQIAVDTTKITLLYIPFFVFHGNRAVSVVLSVIPENSKTMHNNNFF
jgi:hypothetical protein